MVLPFDVTSPTEELEKVVSKAENAFGGIDYIVHNAAHARPVRIPLPLASCSKVLPMFILSLEFGYNHLGLKSSQVWA